MSRSHLIAVVCRRCRVHRMCSNRPDFCGCGSLFHRDAHALIETVLEAQGARLSIEIQVRFVGSAWTDDERAALVDALEGDEKPTPLQAWKEGT